MQNIRIIVTEDGSNSSSITWKFLLTFFFSDVKQANFVLVHFAQALLDLILDMRALFDIAGIVFRLLDELAGLVVRLL